MDVPTKRTVLRRKELKLQPPALMLLSDLGQVFSFDCIQYIRPSPIIIYGWREKSRYKVRRKRTNIYVLNIIHIFHITQNKKWNTTKRKKADKVLLTSNIHLRDHDLQ